MAHRTEGPQGQREPGASRSGPRFELERIELPPKLEIRGHAHPAAHLVLVLRGGFEERLPGGRRQALGAGHIRLSPAAESHDLRFAPIASDLLVVDIPEDPGIPLRSTTLKCDAYVNWITRAMGSGDGLPPDRELRVERILLELLARISGNAREPRLAGTPAWLIAMRGKLESQLGLARGIAPLAREAGIHPVYAARAFRRAFGCSPSEFQRRERLARAVWALRSPSDRDRSLASIALEHGFSDQSHFTREVSRRFGLPPGVLRRRCGREARAGSRGGPQVSGIQDASAGPT